MLTCMQNADADVAVYDPAAHLISFGTWFSISAAGVPSSSLYTNAPMRSHFHSCTNCTSSRCSSGPSPGKPEMNVVRSARPGMRSRSLRSSFMVWSFDGRFILSSAMLLMCCSGMSMYLHTCRARTTDLSSSGARSGMQSSSLHTCKPLPIMPVLI